MGPGDYNPWTTCSYCGGPLGKHGCPNCEDPADDPRIKCEFCGEQRRDCICEDRAGPER